MGFLKRFLSIGSKRKRPTITHHVQISSPSLLTTVDEDQEAAASRLLRSSSARYAIVNEVNYDDLPPIPHPINDIVNTPGASTTSLCSTATSQRGTYSVKVHGRQRHATSGSIASLSSDQSQDKNERHEDSNQLLRLRSDPSVASLLNLYDEHGRIPSEAFSEKASSGTSDEGRIQVKRNGSTLRQLLGDPTNDNSDIAEGDISWAERFLGETDVGSSISSLNLITPNDSDTHFPNTDIHFSDDTDAKNDGDVTFTSHDISSINSSNNQAISSLEVELSSDLDTTTRIEDITQATPVKRQPTRSSTLRRASEVFDFLRKQKSRSSITDSKSVEDRSLPDLPSSAFSSPSSDNHDVEDSPSGRESSSDSISSRSRPSTPAIPTNNPNNFHEDNVDLQTSQTPSHRLISGPKPLRRGSIRRFPSSCSVASASETQSNKRYTSDSSFANTSLAVEALEGGPRVHQAQKVRVIMTVPTKVIVTSATPNAKDSLPPSRIPRGPRSIGHVRRSSGPLQDKSQSHRPILGDSTFNNPDTSAGSDHFTPKPKRKSHSRGGSIGSASTLSLAESEVSRPMKSGCRLPRRKSSRKYTLDKSGKENHEGSKGLTAQAILPSTPLRTQSFSRTAVTPAVFVPPSPNSSTEKALSPVGRKVMMDVRMQRKQAREAERGRKTRKEGPRHF